jgi:hypothetical protein
MSCSIAIVCPFNNRHLFFTFFSFSFLLSFGFVFAPLMQPWPKPWSAATSWDTNVSNKETIFCSSSCLLFHLWSFWAYFFVCKIVWFDHFTHWFMLIGNMSLPAFSITRCVLLNQSFLLRERNLIKKMRECFPLEDLSNVNHPLPRRRRDLLMAPVSNQRWCSHISGIKERRRRDILGVGRTYRSGGGFFRCKYHNSVTLGKVSERWSVWTRETLRNSRDPAESLEWTTHWFSCISQPCQQIWPFISVKRAQHGLESRSLPFRRER